MSRTFDNVDRAKLFDIIRAIPSINDAFTFRLIQVLQKILLASATYTSAVLRISHCASKCNIVSPQGEGLSPTSCFLFTLKLTSTVFAFQCKVL
jgi:hypothetical protein